MALQEFTAEEWAALREKRLREVRKITLTAKVKGGNDLTTTFSIKGSDGEALLAILRLASWPEDVSLELADEGVV
jgi:hypothetical protein